MRNVLATLVLVISVPAFADAPKDKPDGTSSGKPAIADCKNAKETSGYMLFATKADCEEERKTQLANAGGA
ncbi:MAG TPA: hypothetical protein VGM39_22140 [Kofleriaceae bacterium]|jgi:hypothetical protein